MSEDQAKEQPIAIHGDKNRLWIRAGYNMYMLDAEQIQQECYEIHKKRTAERTRGTWSHYINNGLASIAGYVEITHFTTDLEELYGVVQRLLDTNDRIKAVRIFKRSDPDASPEEKIQEDIQQAVWNHLGDATGLELACTHANMPDQALFEGIAYPIIDGAVQTLRPPFAETWMGYYQKAYLFKEKHDKAMRAGLGKVEWYLQAFEQHQFRRPLEEEVKEGIGHFILTVNGEETPFSL